MSKSNRGRLFTTVTVLFVGLLVALLVVWIYQTGASTTLSRDQQQRSARQYAAQAEQEIEDRCLVLDPPAMAECIRGVIESTNEHDRAEDDLVAQTDMAWWAFWMAVISAGALGVTAVGVWYVAMTLREARETTKAAIEGAAHAREQAEQARLANEFAKAEAGRQFDPYLYVSEATYGPPENFPILPKVGSYWVKVTIKNGSNWPAFVKRTHLQAFAFWDGAYVGGNGGAGYGVTAELKPGDVRVLERGGHDYGQPPAVQTFFGVRIEYDTVDGRQRHKDFWLRKAHEYGAPGGWWLDRLDGAPDWLSELPNVNRGPWGTVGDRVPTKEEQEESSRYSQRNMAKITAYLARSKSN